MIEHGLNADAVSKHLGINRSTWYRKLRNGQFTVGEVQRLSEILRLTHDDIVGIFFGSGDAGDAA